MTDARHIHCDANRHPAVRPAFLGLPVDHAPNRGIA